MGFLKSLFGPKEAKMVSVASLGAHFEVPSGQTVLEAALNNNVKFPHNCTVGTCGSCKCKLKSGRVSALTDFGYTLSQQEVQAGFILACQAVPKDALTEIDVESDGVVMPEAEKFTAKMVSSESMTHDILKVTLQLDRPLLYVAGQYANLSYEGLPKARNYSFADAAHLKGRGEVSFFIRKVPGGAFTEALFDGKLKDVSFEVDGPHGNFHLHPGSAPMVCIAGGSGLAPLLSVLETARRDRVDRPCIMLFGARTQADLYAMEQIKELAAGWAGKFVFMPVLSHEAADTSWTGARGLVTQFITDAMPDINWAEAEGYMCGPPGMIDAGIASMTEQGMRLEAIHYDKFTDESHTAKMP
ncbi:2Fe-2S iron-sulfur cluster-binding protein [Polycyclovorans algicola]|uniref:2Fe-2S iron-sulfur cluster-binding protein n=1 Tax=Polycyclovorans algicola TaxID=616992 RepID=UPI0004A6C588|nr:2Fe-2S iron-sulfur cluster binding domain-containing protein [Polycyclovorans algicola]